MRGGGDRNARLGGQSCACLGGVARYALATVGLHTLTPGTWHCSRVLSAAAAVPTSASSLFTTPQIQPSTFGAI